MEQIGYSLIDANGTELQHWGDTLGVCVRPDRIQLPDGSVLEGITGLDPASGWRIAERWLNYGTPGTQFDGTKVVVTRDLAEYKTLLINQLKREAAEFRDKVRTPGKDLVYAEKKDQAHAVLTMGADAANALPDNGAATFPLLAGTVGIEAPTLYDLAQVVWQKYEQWNALSYVIERNEIGGAKNISLASDAAAAKAAYEAIQWPEV